MGWGAAIWWTRFGCGPSATERKRVLELLTAKPPAYETLLRTVALHTQVGATLEDNPIRKAFASLVALGAGRARKQLSQYLTSLSDHLTELERTPSADAKSAQKQTRELLASLGLPGRNLWSPLLLAPLGAKAESAEP